MTTDMKIDKGREKRAWWIAGVCALLLLSGCSSSSESSPAKSAQLSANSVASGSMPNGSAAKEVPGGNPEVKSDDGKPGAAGQVIPVQRKMIFTVNLSLKVSNLDEALKSVESVVNQSQGYLSRMERNSDGFASLELRIPATVMGEALNSLKSMGKVANERKSGQDVTEEYIDVEARIKTLKIEEERLLELIKKGSKLDEILQVERELTRVRGDIERAQGRVKLLDNKIEYATIHLQIEKAKTLDNESPQSAASRAWNGLVDDLLDLVNFGKEAVIWLASNLFTLILLAGGGYIAYRKLKPIYEKRSGGPKGPIPPAQ